MSVINDKVVISRKRSTCYGCALQYPEGTRMHRILWKSSYDNTIETALYCPTCDAYWSEFMDCGDEIGFGDLRNNDPEGWREMMEKGC